MTRKALTFIIVLLFSIQLCGFALTSDNNVGPRSTFVSGTIGSDTTWDLAGSPYIVVGDVTVQNGVTLTIDPGVEVRFDGYFYMRIEGNLTAKGTSSSRIILTSNAAVPFPDDWNRIQVDPAGHLEMEYCELSYSYSGVYVYESQWNSIMNSNFTFNSVGIVLDLTGNNTISENEILSNGESGLVLQSSSFNHILDNTISSTALYQGIWMGWSHNNSIRNNTLTYNGQNGIYMFRSTNNSVVGNNASSNQNYHGISVEESDYNYILNNTLISNHFQGIWMGASSYSTIHNNTAVLNGNNGIYLSSGKHNTITNNTASENLNYHGISIDGTDNNLIANNFANSNNINGIYIVGMENIVRENVVSDNAQEGIAVMGIFNTVVRNTVSSNWDGIRIYGGTGHVVAYNNITSNLNIGLIASNPAFDNLIHGNNLVSSFSDHAYDDYQNFWNDTCGGNYWDDWTGPDTDMNGIVDMPRDIFGGTNKDFLPLTTPAIYKHPSPPTNISVKLEGSTLEHVNITWDSSADESLCYDRVKNYAVYYSSVYDSTDMDYQLLAEVPKGANHYVHSNAGKGDPNTYFYTVQVNDIYTYSGRNETQVAKFNRDLDAGMHLISVPLILENESIGSVLQTVDFNIAWFYDGSYPLDPWKSYNPLKPFNDLTTVNRSMALWVEVLSDSNFTIAGVVPKSTNITLKEGWNLVGYPSFIERNVSVALSAVAYERVEGYSPTPPQFLRIYDDNDLMRPGLGYWVKAASDDVWVLTN